MSALGDLGPESRARVEQLITAKKWQLPGDHPIAELDGLSLGEYRVVALLGPKNAVGSRYFQLFLADASGRLAAEPLALGLQSSGRYPAFNWVELTQFREAVSFGDEALDLWEGGLGAPLFEALRRYAPPGGHLMVEYDSPTHRATERILTLRYQPATSPIGYLMFEQGVRSYRDWYISEGGREGPRKLQGFVPLNEQIEREKTAALKREVAALLERPENPEHGKWGALARELAGRVMQALDE